MLFPRPQGSTRNTEVVGLGGTTKYGVGDPRDAVCNTALQMNGRSSKPAQAVCTLHGLAYFSARTHKADKLRHE